MCVALAVRAAHACLVSRGLASDLTSFSCKDTCETCASTAWSSCLPRPYRASVGLHASGAAWRGQAWHPPCGPCCRSWTRSTPRARRWRASSQSTGRAQRGARCPLPRSVAAVCLACCARTASSVHPSAQVRPRAQHGSWLERSVTHWRSPGLRNASQACGMPARLVECQPGLRSAV